MNKLSLSQGGVPERAALRNWMEQDAEHAALAVCYGRYSLKDALHFLITAGLHVAERAAMPAEMGRAVAVSLFWEMLDRHEARLNSLRWQIVDAARQALANDPDDYDAAALAAAEIARTNNAPEGMVAFGLRIAARAA